MSYHLVRMKRPSKRGNEFECFQLYKNENLPFFVRETPSEHSWLQRGTMTWLAVLDMMTGSQRAKAIIVQPSSFIIQRRSVRVLHLKPSSLSEGSTAHSIPMLAMISRLCVACALDTFKWRLNYILFCAEVLRRTSDSVKAQSSTHFSPDRLHTSGERMSMPYIWMDGEWVSIGLSESALRLWCAFGCELEYANNKWLSVQISLQTLAVAEGLKYLHGICIIHGDIKGVGFVAWADPVVILTQSWSPLGENSNLTIWSPSYMRIWNVLFSWCFSKAGRWFGWWWFPSQSSMDGHRVGQKRSATHI